MLRCTLNVYEIHNIVIDRLGQNLGKLQLKCDFDSDFYNCSKECTEENQRLDINQIKTILTKCPNLEKLEINGRNLSERFLSEVEYMYKVKLSVDFHKRKAMKRFKSFNPRFYENLTYF